MSELDKIGLKCQNPRITERKGLWGTFPIEAPVGPRSPSVAIDKEGELAVIEQELAVETFNMNWLNAVLPCHEVERRVGLIEEGLRLERLETDHLEAAGTGHAQFGFEEMHRGRLGGNVKLLERPELVLTSIEHLTEAFLLLSLGHGIVRFVDLDRGRERRNLHAAHEMATHADTCLEKVAVGLNLLSFLPGPSSVVGVEDVERKGKERFLGKDQQQLVLLKYINLRDDCDFNHTFGRCLLILGPAIRHVDTIIGSVKKFAAAVKRHDAVDLVLARKEASREGGGVEEVGAGSEFLLRRVDELEPLLPRRRAGGIQGQLVTVFAEMLEGDGPALALLCFSCRSTQRGQQTGRGSLDGP